VDEDSFLLGEMIGFIIKKYIKFIVIINKIMVIIVISIQYMGIIWGIIEYLK